MNITIFRKTIPKKPIFRSCHKQILLLSMFIWLMMTAGEVYLFAVQHKIDEPTHLYLVSHVLVMTALSGLVIFSAACLLWRCCLRSIRQYQYILNQVHDCIYLIDASSLSFRYVNQSGRNQVGYSQEELTSMTPADIKPEFTLVELQHKFAPLVTGEKNGILLETVHLTKEGRLVPVEVFVQYLHVDNVGYFLAVARDITDKRAALTEKEMLEEKLRESQRMEGIATLAAGIAHDFNNLLTVILGYVELAMMQANRDDRVTEDLQIVLNAGHRARDLVQQILTFSREKSGRKQPQWLQPLVKEVVKMVKASISSSIRFVQKIDEDAGMVMVDPVQFHQLLMNLCVNALDAMEEDGGVLTISLSEVEIDPDTPASRDLPPPGRYVRISVQDTGPGMEPWIMAKIFDPYFTTKKKGKGTGLGLAVVHGIVEGHGGYITVNSEPGQGSKFDVYFPQKAQEKSEPDRADKSWAGSPQGPGLRIMVVDDEPVIVNLTERILTRLGHNATGFPSATAALEAFKNDPNGIDLLLTDLDMPDKNGMEMAREMKRLRPDLPIILCTGYDTTVAAADLEQTGIKDILLKPLTSHDLARAVARAMTRKTEQDRQKIKAAS